MSTARKSALIFLGVINIMNIVAGIIVHVKLFMGADVTSVLPIRTNMTVTQILLLNFIVISTVIFLLSVVVTYLVTDIPYSPLEIIANCPQLAIIPVALITIAGVVNTVMADVTADKIWIIVTSVFYLLFNIFNFGAMITIKEDA